MRLVNAKIQGYGRLVNTSVNLDSKVIAVVGPNEAGKTTLLNALAFLNEDRALKPMERSRVGEVSDETVVTRVKFIVEESDLSAIKLTNLDALPISVEFIKKASGETIQMNIEPFPRKPRKDIESAARQLDFYAANFDSRFRKLFVERFDDDGSDSALKHDFKADLEKLIKALRVRLHQARDNDETDKGIAKQASDLIESMVESHETKAFRNELTTVQRWTEMDDPQQEVRETLWSRTPKFVMFNDTDRTLLSSYVLDRELVASPPNALRNLARLAELDLAVLLGFIEKEIVPRYESEIIRVNENLARYFKGAWKQANMSVRLKVEGNLLRVQVFEDGKYITTFDERSAGFQMFIALVAFLATRETSTPPILLIDEAENHLHIDGQVDLVNMFMLQDKADRVIYTTHSPACLPPDLGVGVRSVSRNSDNGEISEIRNSFWTSGPGFSPLVIAMGAGAAAFTTNRFVVLAEGATEMILLPSLLRKATGLETLKFQVAPGLSEVPREFLANLDYEGAKVAYLVDSDDGGQQLRAFLIKNGVPDDRIVKSPIPGIENALPPDTYLEVITMLLREKYITSKISDMPVLVGPKVSSWAKQIEEWCLTKGLREPSKIAVACRLLEDQNAHPSDETLVDLQTLHTGLLTALKI